MKLWLLDWTTIYGIYGIWSIWMSLDGISTASWIFGGLFEERFDMFFVPVMWSLDCLKVLTQTFWTWQENGNTNRLDKINGTFRCAVIPLVLLAVALLASRSSVFVPPPSTSRLPAAAVAVPALLAGAPAAFADAIGDAAAKFSDATYPIAKKIDWGILDDETSTLWLPKQYKHVGLYKSFWTPWR